MISSVIIGYGFAGRRMQQVIEFERSRRPKSLAAPVIVDPAVAASGGPAFRSLGDALTAGSYDAAIVTVNEENHHDILSQLAATDIPLVLCEKPLTSTLAQARDIAPRLRGKRVSLNMVERYSPVFDAYFDWRDSVPGLTVSRVTLFWGKDRLRDTRPTIGVLSEVIHPLDLAAYAFGLSDVEVTDGFMHHSDFANHNAVPVADSVHCRLTASSGCTISAHASFAWVNRRREMFAMMSDGVRSYLAHFQFDMPLWDCDRVTVHSIDAATGRRTCVMHAAFDNDDFPTDLLQLNKVHRFVTTSLAHQYEHATPPALVGLDRALVLQEWLDKIDCALNRHPGGHDALFPALVPLDAAQ